MSELVTAIIPNYNHARFLQRRLESVYGQTYPHLRVILLDDASTDDSRTILETYRHHPRTQAIVYNDTNSSSPFLQWKKGLDLVETEWVWIAESDDYCEVDFLDSLIPGFKTSECVLAYAQLNWVDEAGAFIKHASPPEKSGWYKGNTFVQNYIFGWNRLQNAGMIVFRKTAAMKANPKWIQMKQAGDYWLWADVAAQGGVYGSGKPRCYITKHEASVTAKQLSTQKAQDEIVDTWKQMLAVASITPTQLKNRIESELVGLLCVRRNLSEEDFRLKWDIWKQLLNSLDLRINIFRLNILALKAKCLHKIVKTRIRFILY